MTNEEVQSCDGKAMDQFIKMIKTTILEIGDFNSSFMDFLNQQKKHSKELWNWVTRYNILDA